MRPEPPETPEILTAPVVMPFSEFFTASATLL